MVKLFEAAPKLLERVGDAGWRTVQELLADTEQTRASHVKYATRTNRLNKFESYTVKGRFSNVYEL